MDGKAAIYKSFILRLFKRDKQTSESETQRSSHLRSIDY